MFRIKNHISKLNLLMSLVLISLMIGCTSEGLQEDTAPTVEAPRNTVIQEIPGPVIEMFIGVKLEGDFDPESFRNQYGPALGLLGYQTCNTRNSTGNREIWTVPFSTKLEFLNQLMTLFPEWVPLDSETQSNGRGGYQSYVVYRSSSPGSGNQADWAPFQPRGSITFEYAALCN